ncbi:MAG: ArsR family transcriptional regulator, arsenate/arsenite/antimonite-responsive transcriptional [Frankiales bacterium]|nr:ArsR family transcriptional regulator, arsenate/arsenite/antimonite-responsive transcriptional [Frankiales bacterium]
MSKQDGHEEQVLAALAEVVGCCSPLAREPLSADQSVELAQVFKAMGDPVRLRLLSLIASHAGGEACVCDLTDVFDLSGPTISHHLKVLREAGLITGERRGTWIYYRVRPELLAQVSAVLVPAAPDNPAVVMPAGREALPVVEQ